MGEWEQFMRGLTLERFTHVPQATGPVEGPTRAQMDEDRRMAIEEAHKVVLLPVPREGIHRQQAQEQEETG